MGARVGLNVAIVEDDRGTREALAFGLQAMGMTVLGAFGSGEEALAALDAGEPGIDEIDVALVDLGLPGCSGTELIGALRTRRPDLPALVLTVFESPSDVVDAIEAGARGYLLKGTPLPDIVAAITEISEGLSPISPAVARHLLDRLQRRPPQRAPALTDREREVLDLLVRGHSYASVGVALAIGVGTVQSHVKNLYRKLEVSSKAEATAVAIRQGLVGE